MTTIISKRSKASHVASIVKTTSISSRLTSAKPKGKVRFQLPYARKVRVILQNYVENAQQRDYEDLVVLIRDAELFDEDVKNLLDEATECISILNCDLRLFVEALLSVQWPCRSAGVVTFYQSFILNLLCAHNYHAKFAIEKLVQQFVPAPDEKDWVNGEIPIGDQQRYINVHFVIDMLLNNIPMCKDILIHLLSVNFPYLKKSSHAHEVYVHNLLCILEYKPVLRTEILRLLFSKLVILDVHAPREEIEKAESAEPMEEDVFHMEEDIPEMEKMKCSVAASLDICMNKFFDYLLMETHNIETGELIWDTTKNLYHDLLHIFDTIILPTYNVHHVQFAMFALCSLKTALTEAFLNHLWRKVTTPNVAAVLRMAAVSYISGMIARATFVPVPMINGTLQQMADWIHAYIANQDGNEYINCDLRVHGVFYAVCQALFYVVAFRKRDLFAISSNVTVLESLNLAKIVTCKLNPLRVCQPAVVQNFAAVTRKYQLAYCYSVIEHNARNVMPTIYQDEKGSNIGRNHILDAFFPFDPYLLKISGNKILPFYIAKCRKQRKADRKQRHVVENVMEDDDFLATEATISTSPTKQYEKFCYGTSPGFKFQL